MVVQSGGTGEGEDHGTWDSAGLTLTPASLTTLVLSSLLTCIQRHPPPVHRHPLLGISEDSAQPPLLRTPRLAPEPCSLCALGLEHRFAHPLFQRASARALRCGLLSLQSSPCPLDSSSQAPRQCSLHHHQYSHSLFMGLPNTGYTSPQNPPFQGDLLKGPLCFHPLNSFLLPLGQRTNSIRGSG